jgi:hypothetical protein
VLLDGPIDDQTGRAAQVLVAFLLKVRGGVKHAPARPEHGRIHLQY